MIQIRAPCGTPCGAGVALASLGYLPSSGAWLPAGPARQPDCRRHHPRDARLAQSLVLGRILSQCLWGMRGRVMGMIDGSQELMKPKHGALISTPQL